MIHRLFKLTNSRCKCTYSMPKIKVPHSIPFMTQLLDLTKQLKQQRNVKFNLDLEQRLKRSQENQKGKGGPLCYIHLRYFTTMRF